MSERHVIVTGGSRGLGAELVEDLLKAGYWVSTCSRSKSEFIERLEGDHEYRDRFLWRSCTVGEADEVDAFVAECVQWGGASSLYGLINNSGVAQPGILASFPNAETERIIRVNLLGAIQMTRAFCRVALQNQEGGRIINITSIIGSRGFNGLSAYSASKAGLDGFTRAMARELGRRQITVNAIAPGYFRTEMSSAMTERQLKQITNRTPLGRLATEQDFTGLIRFFLSDASSFITGQTILVDGGMTC